MKKIEKRILLGALLATLACSAVALTACNDDKKDSGGAVTPPPVVTPSKPDLQLSANSIDVLLGNSVQLTAIYEATDDKELIWSSSAPAIVSITDDGMITALDSGSATITATYGELTATCAVNVVFGDQQPVLMIKNVLTDNVKFIGAQGFAIDAVVMFNGVEFPCELVVESDNEAVTYTDGKLFAQAGASAQINVSANWKGFDTSLLTSSFSVTAIPDVSIVSFVTVGGQEMATDTIELSIVDEWCGKTYETEASVQFLGVCDGVETALTDLELIEGSEYVTFDASTGDIKAIDNMRGTAKVRAGFEVAGITYHHTLNINVTCPVEEYTDLLTYDTSGNFPLEVFGDGANMKEAYQGNDKLTVRRGTKRINGVIAQGNDTEELTVYTSKGAYRFTNLFVYDKLITQSNFVQSLMLGSTVVEGYMVLESDVTVDMTGQRPGSKNVYFAGTFDGRGHKVSASVGRSGIFGQVGGLNPTIKNTHFEFTFVAGSNGTAVGLAGNEYMLQMENETTDNNRIRPHLNNLYITSTNYLAKSYVLMGESPYFITMTDIYVNVNVGAETTGAGSEKALLYRGERTLYNSAAAATPRIRAYKNVYLVTGAFLALADIAYTDGTGHSFAFTTYAKTDLAKIGGDLRVANTGSTESMKINPTAQATAEQIDKYYKADRFGKYTVYTYHGVERYNTVAELTETGVTVVGSWTVA